MPGPSVFFDTLREWSRWKHEVLRRYLPKFAGILGSWYGVIWYVDGFAGAGTYGEEARVPGSPLIGAGLAETVATLRRRYRLQCINVEPTHFRALERATANYQPPLLRNLEGTFRQHLPTILGLTGDDPALFFLDPFGYEGMEWDVLQAVARRTRRAKTELLINFNAPEIYRKAGWLHSPEPNAPAFVRSLNELFGTDGWQPISLSCGSQTTCQEELTLLYMTRAATLFRGFGAAYPVRTVEGQLKYYLVYLTQHQRGCRAMTDVLYRVEHEYQEWSAQERERFDFTYSMDDFLASPPQLQERQAQLVGDLANDIYQLGAGRGTMTFGELQDYLCSGKWFGRALEKHFRAACKNLIHQGKIARDKDTAIEEATRLRFVAS